METIVITVSGMSCQHCVAAVRDELARIPGVSEVSVDLGRGTAEILAEPRPDSSTLRAAVTEAGYEVVDIS